MIRENLWLKAAAVVLAVALWMFVMARTYTSITISVPVEFRNMPAGLEVVREESSISTTLGLRGPVRIVKNMVPGDVHVTADLRGASEGRNQVVISRIDVELPSLIRLININPATLDVTLRQQGGGADR